MRCLLRGKHGNTALQPAGAIAWNSASNAGLACSMQVLGAFFQARQRQRHAFAASYPDEIFRIILVFVCSSWDESAAGAQIGSSINSGKRGLLELSKNAKTVQFGSPEMGWAGSLRRSLGAIDVKGSATPLGALGPRARINSTPPKYQPHHRWSAYCRKMEAPSWQTG
jgi:hypothetical protein